MGYTIIPVVASIVLALHHVIAVDASRRSKIVVVVVVVASLWIWRYAPQRMIVATLLQVGISVYMLAYLRWRGLTT